MLGCELPSSATWILLATLAIAPAVLVPTSGRPLVVCAVQAPLLADDGFIQFTPPPGPATASETALLEGAKQALESHRADVSAILIDAAYLPIHARTEFRELIAAHASAAPLTMCGREELGTRLTMTLEFVDSSGAPIRDALLYAYHTSAKGWYSDKGAHIKADSGDIRHARLFGYTRTDASGQAELRTIRPAGYPQSELPAHIHLGLTVSGRSVLVSEVQFDDDPRLTPMLRERAAREGVVITKVIALDDGSQRGQARFVVKMTRD